MYAAKTENTEYLPSGSAAALIALSLPFLPDPKALAPQDLRKAFLWSAGAVLHDGKRGPLGARRQPWASLCMQR